MHIAVVIFPHFGVILCLFRSFCIFVIILYLFWDSVVLSCFFGSFNVCFVLIVHVFVYFMSLCGYIMVVLRVFVLISIYLSLFCIPRLWSRLYESVCGRPFIVLQCKEKNNSILCSQIFLLWFVSHCSHLIDFLIGMLIVTRLGHCLVQ